LHPQLTIITGANGAGKSPGVDHRSPAINFGEAKGRGFDHVVILPTEPMRKWRAVPGSKLVSQCRARFYVAMTRARHSVVIAMDWGDRPLTKGFSFYKRAELGLQWAYGRYPATASSLD
jgi:superfamily I DNA/RNA helicase